MEYIKRLQIYYVENRILCLILVLSIVLSLSYSFYYKIEPKVDARAYDEIAQNILAGNGYREKVDLPFENDYSIARVGPIYEYFLAVVYLIFGHSYFMVWMIQALLHSLTAYLVYKTTLLIFEEKDNKKYLALWAAGIFAFYPDLIEISAMLLTETLYLFFVCFSLYLFFYYKRNPTFNILVLLSVVCGVTVLARPPFLVALPVILVCLYKESIKKLLLFAAIVLVVFLPWSVRNYVTFKKVMPFGVAGQANLWIGNHVGANGEQEASEEMNQFIREGQIDKLGDISTEKFFEFLRGHPDDFIKLTLLRVNKYFSFLRPMGFWFYNSGIKQMLFVASSLLASLILFIAGFAGVFKSIHDKNTGNNLKYFIIFTVTTPLLIFITVVETRYRFQIYPMLAIFAGYFIASFKEDPKNSVRYLIVASLLMLLNGFIDLGISWESFQEKIVSKLS